MSKRKTIGVLIDHADYPAGGYEGQLRAGFEVACRRLDLDLLLFFGRPLESPFYRAQQRVYDLATRDCVDGIVLVAAGLGTFTGREGVEKLCHRLRPLPMVSVGLALEAAPSIIADNRPGIDGLVDHLLDAHGCRRPAFIGGPPQNPDALDRAQAFQAALQRRGLAFDPARSHAGDFTLPSGSSAMAILLERGIEFDAIVAANDGMALGAIETLKSRGFRVPQQIPVTGFDDLEIARLVNPPLTTVRQPLEDMASLAIELVAQQIAGEPVPQRSELAVEIVCRRSCGCARATRVASPPSTANLLSAERFVAEQAERLVNRLAALLSDAGANARESALMLVTGLRAELEGKADSFEIAIDAIIDQAGEQREFYEQLQNCVSLLRAEFSGRATSTEHLWHEARTQLALASTRASGRQRLHTEMQYQHLVHGAERLLTAFDLPSLKAVLAEELPGMGVRNALFALFSDVQPGQLVPFLCLREGAPVELAAQRYPATKLVPDDAPVALSRQTRLLWPLAADTQQFGLAVIEVGHGAGAPEMLREQITAALQSSSLHREIVSKTALHERSVQERLATAKRMSALNVLAGGVAHDLNNALGPLVALPDLILRELDASGADAAYDLSEVRADVSAIKSAALRATQTIKDLLTSARQGRTKKEVFDLNQVLEALLDVEIGSFSRNAQISITLELAKEALFVLASESHIQRALSNLLRNAIEAIDPPGRVLIQTGSTRLSEPLMGYETIEPGDYVTISVSDTGRGIATAELGRLFEPFFTKKPVGETSGSGLGLAIVHGVVKEHGGFVNVESMLGRGTTFTLYFGKAAPSAFVHEAQRQPSSMPSALNVLVIDDDPMQLRTAQRILSRRGHRVTAIASGREALARMQTLQAHADLKSPYDLIMLDMLLNEADDGLTLSERICERFPNQKCIIVSGHAPSERGLLAVERGLTWLCKPYTAEQLLNTVETSARQSDPPSGVGHSQATASVGVQRNTGT